ncbi:MAG: NAD(P)-dependent oxidoreductase [Ancalomicrobiaceae bacterium]|nr:NAD(P)-dependent oxidoreductase [Ancalomicrobiaceae bacterium]
MSSTPDIAPGRLPAATIAKNFGDINPPFDRFEARVASERCLFCYDAPCIKACPTSIDIPLFIRQIMADNPIGAARTIFRENILGGMCARVCPTETLCEQACVRNASEGKPIEIGQLQRYATDSFMGSGLAFAKRAAPTGRKVAVVGAGPAGLACAHRLALLGHAVTLLDARTKAGGLNEFGIAAYKATDGFAAKEVAFILSIGGITLDLGKRLGADIALADLKRDYDAVFLGVGLGGVNDLGLEDSLDGVENAVDYIADLRQASDLASLAVGRKVVVIGGGMTAIDIASQTKRLGADEVTLVYRRGQERMNASDYEQQLAQTDGVLIRTWARPKRVIGSDGKLEAVEFETTEETDGKLVGTGETYTLHCDQLFRAIGQSFLAETLGASGIAVTGGRIEVDAERKTSVAGIWAGGDCVAGGEDLTVSAVADGREAAISIDRALKLASA